MITHRAVEAIFVAYICLHPSNFVPLKKIISLWDREVLIASHPSLLIQTEGAV